MHVHLCVALWLFLFTRLLFLFVPLLFFRPFQMSSSKFHEKLKSKALCDFRLGTVATSDHETPLTKNTPEVLSLGKLCDENGYSYEWINGHKPHLIKDGIRIICNTENFVPVVVPGLSSSPSGSTLALRTPLKQESHSSSSSSSSSSSPTVREIQI